MNNIKIYKIWDLETQECYIGSTKQKYIADRIARHRNYMKNEREYCSSSKVLKNNNYSYICIEECDQENRKERERYHINNTPLCVNERKLNFTKKGWEQKIITCECGSMVRRSSFNRHCKSKKHINSMNLDNPCPA